jgi:CheY-like chemotaxis protein
MDGSAGRPGVVGSIVLAEDERDVRSLYAACLRGAGHVVWEAVDGQEALALVLRHQPALLLLDVWMPGLNGFEVLDHLRADAGGTGVKVVMLSNLTDADTRLECFAAGASDYWLKGDPLAEFCARVNALLGTPCGPPASD